MVIPYDRPVTWREFTRSEGQDPELIQADAIDLGLEPPALDVLLDQMVDRHEAILAATLGALRMEPGPFMQEVMAGRVQWLCEWWPGRYWIQARSGGGDWIDVPGVLSSPAALNRKPA